MFKKIIVGALVILGSFGIAANSEAHHRDYNYRAEYCANDSYCDDYCCDENYARNYRGNNGGCCGCR